MKVQDILSAVESLSFRQRAQFMYELGQRSHRDPVLQESLGTLASSSVQYERLLALQSVWGSKDVGTAAKLLTDYSAQIGAMAVRVAIPILSDDEMTEIMPTLPKPRRFAVAKELAIAKRRNVIDRILPQLGNPEVTRLLPYATVDFAQNYLARDDVFPLATADWTRLASQFPLMAQSLLKQRITASIQPEFDLIVAVKTVIICLCKKNEAALALELLTVASVKIPFKELPYVPLTRYYPDEIAQMILASSQPERCRLRRAALRRLDVKRLLALEDANVTRFGNSSLGNFEDFTRTELYRASRRRWREHTGALPLNVVMNLQTEDREREARHAFALPLLEADPEHRLPYLACLPWEESLAAAAPFLAQADGDLRAVAVRAVIGVGRFYRDHLDAILDFCIRRENEQDPVRRVMVGALTDLPPGRWQVIHLPKLKAIVDAALVARDCSISTLDTASKLLAHLLPFHIEFVTNQLPVLAERAGYFYAREWEDRINDHLMAALSPQLLPMFEVWVNRDRHDFVYSMIASFGRRLRAAPELIQLLISLTEDERSDIASRALSRLAIRDLEQLLRRHIPALLESDESWIRDSDVLHHVLSRRQDLLTPFLLPRPYLTGRFQTYNDSFWSPSINRRFVTLTAAQQEAYAAVQVAIIDSPKRTIWEIDSVVHCLGAMPSIDVAPLVRYARLGIKDVSLESEADREDGSSRAPDKYLRDKALESLGRCDAGRGIPALVDALGDDRARIAIYALRRSILQMSVLAALSLIRSVPLHKLTVAKEVIRLAGELNGKDAFEFLTSYMSRPNLHNDIRVALLRALWSYLEREEVWPLFIAAAESEEFGVARATIRIPQDRLTDTSRRRLVNLITILLAHKDARIRRDTLHRLIEMPLGAAGVGLNEPLSHLLGAKDGREASLAAKALLRGNVAIDPELLGPTFAKLTLPRALLAVTNAFMETSPENPDKLAIAARLFIDSIVKQQQQCGLAAKLALVTLPVSEATSMLRRLAVGGLLHPGAVDDTIEAIHQVARGRRYTDLSHLELLLSAAEQNCLRRLGLASLVALAGRDGWRKKKRSRLRCYRQDTDRWISDEADRLKPPRRGPKRHKHNH